MKKGRHVSYNKSKHKNSDKISNGKIKIERTEKDPGPEEFMEEEYLLENFDETAVCNSLMICRICAQNEGPFVNALHKPVLLDEIEKCLSLKINIEDELPKVVCIQCENRLNSIIDLRSLCKKNQKMLAALVLRKKQIKKAQSNGLESHAKNIPKLSSQQNGSQKQTILQNGNHATQSDTIIAGNAKAENVEGAKSIEAKPKPQQFHCSNCNLNFNSKRGYLNHYRELHLKKENTTPQNSGTPFICEICSKTFSTTKHLKAHIRFTHVVQQSKCPYDECDSIFDNNTKLRRHINFKHLKTCESVCSECGKSLRTPSHLRKHIAQVHRNIREFVCPQCNKAFQTQYNLRTHLKSHTQIAEYHCSFCSKGFVYKHVLKQHIKRDHGITYDEEDA